ncbi:unnamed protein product [Didymodactylos carnosus]|uniref:Glucose-methanol-choline oxidoreductase N-terminal domain-containing protein n=1 Tax=Didymodactylos carnosus TaxID=1234261 RepID=A0A815K7S8_9BILA|nr:unnamed protein product [Didymodactylos carnosus]CAF1392000.1 unnamed protein product [Didymodactylos carnosus]CAF4138251.1 unnamed protein product [Didymodactylos carnosus]CAF4286528.1 unnamed protein product [Didymodactylos carnosus]
MGAIRSSQLLRLSGVGNQSEVKSLSIPLVHHLPGVGENLQDHPLTAFTFGSVIAQAPGSIIDQAAYDLYRANKTGILASIIARTNFFMRTKYQPINDTRPDVQVIVTTPGPSLFGLV